MNSITRVFYLAIALTVVFSTLAYGAEEYTAVDPTELHCGLMGFSGGTEVGEGGVRILGGKFDKLLCEGKEIAVVTNKVDGGFINTKEYGKIKVTSGGFGGATVHLTPSQKKKVLELKKTKANN
jgi:hypothetical protein